MEGGGALASPGAGGGEPVSCGDPRVGHHRPVTDHVSLRPSRTPAARDALDRALTTLVERHGLDAVWVGDEDGLLVRGAARHSGDELETLAALAPLEGELVRTRVEVEGGALIVGARGASSPSLAAVERALASLVG